MQKQLKDVNCYVLERDQIRKASEEMEARYQNQIAKLTQSLQQHDIEKLKMEEEREEKDRELELLREEVEGLKRASEGLKKENEGVKRESEGVKKENEGVKRENEGVKEEMSEKENQLVQLQREIDEWKEKWDRLNAEMKEKSERNEELEEWNRMKMENESLRSELNEMKNENESLKGELERVKMENEREELTEYAEELERMKQENESLREELERGKEGVATADTVALIEELDKLNKVNATLREELIKLSAERKNILNPLLSHQLPRGYQIDMNEFSEFNDQQSLEGESDFRTHPPEQFFYSSPLPTSSSSLEAYRLVISQLYREVLSLQRENESLSAQLDAAKPLQITISPPGMEESNEGVKSLIASMQMTMQTLQVTLKEKNDLIAKLNAQLQQFLSDSHLNEELSLNQGEVETENVQGSEEQTESEGEEEEEEEEPPDPEPKGQDEEEEEEDQNDREEEEEDQNDRKEEEEDQKDREEAREKEQGASPKHDFSQEMQIAREETERMRQSCEQLMEEKNAKEKLLEAQRSREQQLSDEVSSLQKQVFTLEAKREELQNLLSLSRQNIQQLSSLFKGQLGQLRDSLSSLPPLLAAQQTSMRGEMETTIRTSAAKYAFLTNHLLSSRQLISSLRDELQNYKGNYRVMIRVRPINNTDTSTHSCIRITDEYNISIQSEDSRNEPKSFVFDRILPPAASQEELFLEIEPAVLSVFRGINSTILAYGQTGSGKTYSMVGEKGRLGLTFRSCHLLFEEFQYRSDTPYELKVRSIHSIDCRSASLRSIAKHFAICWRRVGRSAYRSLQRIDWSRSRSSPFLPSR